MRAVTPIRRLGQAERREAGAGSRSLPGSAIAADDARSSRGMQARAPRGNELRYHPQRRPRDPVRLGTARPSSQRPRAANPSADLGGGAGLPHRREQPHVLLPAAVGRQSNVTRRSKVKRRLKVESSKSKGAAAEPVGVSTVQTAVESRKFKVKRQCSDSFVIATEPSTRSFRLSPFNFRLLSIDFRLLPTFPTPRSWPLVQTRAGRTRLSSHAANPYRH